MISLEKSLSLVQNKTKVLPVERVKLMDSLNRILAEDIKADFDIPSFDRSAMDGYAVYSEDTRYAEKTHPVILEVKDEIKAGDKRKMALKRNSAISIMTGAPVPSGCDSVIKIEDVEEIKEGNIKKIKIFKPVEPGKDISYRGEDIKKGNKVLKKGTLIDSSVFAMLAYLGKTRIKVHKRPRVAILSTGDEIKNPGEKRARNEIYNANGYGLYALTLKSGGLPEMLGIASDRYASLNEFVKKGLGYDILLISGGVSEGRYDIVIDVLKKNMVRMVFWKVAIKPGKPVFFGIKEKTLVFGLPGYPVSTYINFENIVKPAIYKMTGRSIKKECIIPACLKESLENKGDRDNFLRINLVQENDKIFAIPYPHQMSGVFSSIVESNGLIRLKKGESKKQGETVFVRLLEK